MDKAKILQEAKAELERHVWGTFVEGNATVALGGTGVIVSGEACRKRFGTNSQYLRHLSEDVLPNILRRLWISLMRQANISGFLFIISAIVGLILFTHFGWAKPSFERGTLILIGATNHEITIGGE
jgi:hypothetical protein